MASIPRWMQIAADERGTKEIKGSQHNPRVLEYHAATSLRATDDETPWCASFVNWVLQEAGIKGTNSAAARSFSNWGVESELELGAIVVLQRGSKSWQGHVGFVDHFDGDFVWVLGGNQSNEVNVQTFRRSDIVAVRKPKTVTKSKTVAVSTVGIAATGLSVIEQVKPQFVELSAQFDWAHYVLAGLTLAAFGFVVYERIKKIRNEGV